MIIILQDAKLLNVLVWKVTKLRDLVWSFEYTNSLFFSGRASANNCLLVDGKGVSKLVSFCPQFIAFLLIASRGCSCSNRLFYQHGILTQFEPNWFINYQLQVSHILTVSHLWAFYVEVKVMGEGEIFKVSCNRRRPVLQTHRRQRVYRKLYLG